MSTARAIRAPQHGPYPIGLLTVLVTVAMLFSAFTAALLLRRTASDWIPITWPPLVWVNTAILLASSVALEQARRAARIGRNESVLNWISIGAVLGLAFVAGQLALWRALGNGGVFLASGPHAAFVYLLTGTHAVHVVGGIGGLSWAFARAQRGGFSASHDGLSSVIVYWHFVGIVWLWLFALLSAL
ncbi:MAG TPA: cytochrome c oxidase subunit 3 [Gemmatimonadales bacterium]|nr:cytochrome c oxidase subunit 3 [Gemmatimonadales bacterium]